MIVTAPAFSAADLNTTVVEIKPVPVETALATAQMAGQFELTDSASTFDGQWRHVPQDNLKKRLNSSDFTLRNFEGQFPFALGMKVDGENVLASPSHVYFDVASRQAFVVCQTESGSVVLQDNSGKLIDAFVNWRRSDTYSPDVPFVFKATLAPQSYDSAVVLVNPWQSDTSKQVLVTGALRVIDNCSASTAEEFNSAK